MRTQQQESIPTVEGLREVLPDKLGSEVTLKGKIINNLCTKDLAMKICRKTKKYLRRTS
jgi:hypothetical protein